MNDPGVIVACADFFMQKDAYAPAHAAELLKASLIVGNIFDSKRKGRGNFGHGQTGNQQTCIQGNFLHC